MAQQKADLELPEQRLWTRVEYERVVNLGMFEGERLELLEGRIVRKMPQNSPHATSIQLVADVLRSIFTPGYVVRVQAPLALADSSEPEPDVAVVAGSVRDFAAAHPASAVLVVEVSDTSLAVDRVTKAGIYARSGVPEYWIVNLSKRELIVHTDPRPDMEQPLGYRYTCLVHLTGSDTVTPLGMGTAIRVSDMLP